MVGFYKHDIPAWMDGTEALSDGAYRTYHVIVQLIMLNEGPIALNERGIAGRCNQSIKSFRVHLDVLLRTGKLVLDDGRLSNARAETELQSVRKNRANAGLGGLRGKKSPEKSREQVSSDPSPSDERCIDAAKPLQYNDLGQAPLKTISSLKEKRREDSPKVPKGTDPEGFEEFWKAYPKRDGDNSRKTALRAYAKVVGGGVEPAALLRAVKAMAAEMQAKGKAGTELVPMAATWLNQGRFERFTEASGGQSGSPPTDPDAFLAGLTEAVWREQIRRWKGTGGQWLLAQRTPPPDDPRTKAPAHLLAEIGIRHGPRRATLELLTGTG